METMSNSSSIFLLPNLGEDLPKTKTILVETFVGQNSNRYPFFFLLEF